MNKKSGAIVAGSLIGTALLVRAFSKAPLTKQVGNEAAFTPAGRAKVGLLRPLATGVAMVAQYFADRPAEAVRITEQVVIPTSQGDVKATFYWPLTPTTEPLPVLVNLHGGGFVLGWPMQDDLLCRYLAQQAQCLVVNVDYSTAPQATFPVPLEQCYGVVRWVHREAANLKIDARRLAISGQSAGGNLAAAVALLAKERQEFTLALQILTFPFLNLLEAPAHKNILPGYRQAISPAIVEGAATMYTPNKRDRANPLASPGLATDLAGLAPALIITAGHDTLLSDGTAYADKLRQQGVVVTSRTFAGVDHAFTHVGASGPALQAWELIADMLKHAFQPQPT